MANIFLNKTPRDIETAIMLEQAIIHDIGNAVAFTDGDKIYINTPDNLDKILPAYNDDMLKWLLWHERFHKELSHHSRFFKYLQELNEKETIDKFAVTKEEVNIIMDILVHDSLSKMFPEIVPVAVENFAQMRNRNSLKHTFTTTTLEDMLDEYAKTKKPDGKDEQDSDGKDAETKDGEGKGEKDGMGTDKKTKEDSKKKSKKKSTGGKKGHAESKDEKPELDDGAKEDGEPEMEDGAEKPDISEHEKTDWSKLKDIDTKEFLDCWDADRIASEVNRLRNRKIKLGRLTETLNGLATSTRMRTYAKPCPIRVGGGVVLKGSKPGKAKLYLCFDASGSMGYELETFKEIISKSIPQAMETPTEWFTDSYGKAKFKDFMDVHAWNGFSDDGDRVIELCWKAEQAGYTPIGVTDGGGKISWSKDKLRQLKRTILVGQNKSWLERAKEINPNIQIQDI